MRYNPRYHQKGHGTKHHRRMHWASFIILVTAIVLMAGVAKTPLDMHKLLEGFVLSLGRVSAAYAICLLLSLVFGLLTVSSSKAEALLLPVMDLLQSFPTFAILPVLVYYFGHSSASVIVILVIAMVWPIMFSIISGVKEERRDQAEAAKVFGARGWKHLFYYRLPMLRPFIMTGSIVSWGQAWDTIVGAEIIAEVTGAGRFLGSLGAKGQTSLLALGILVYLLLIFVINQLVWLPLLHRYTKYANES